MFFAGGYTCNSKCHSSCSLVLYMTYTHMPLSMYMCTGFLYYLKLPRTPPSRIRNGIEITGNTQGTNSVWLYHFWLYSVFIPIFYYTVRWYAVQQWHHWRIGKYLLHIYFTKSIETYQHILQRLLIFILACNSMTHKVNFDIYFTNMVYGLNITIYGFGLNTRTGEEVKC